MTKVSPIAEYLRVNKAIPKHDNNGCHFISPEGLYLGRLTKQVVNSYKVITLETFGEGFKKMYTKSVAIGQRFAYVKNNSAVLGISIVPVKTYMRKIFVDFIERVSDLQDSEKTLANNLELLAIDEATHVGLFDTEKPFKYNTSVYNQNHKSLKNHIFVHTIN